MASYNICNVCENARDGRPGLCSVCSDNRYARAMTDVRSLRDALDKATKERDEWEGLAEGERLELEKTRAALEEKTREVEMLRAALLRTEERRSDARREHEDVWTKLNALRAKVERAVSELDVLDPSGPGHGDAIARALAILIQGQRSAPPIAEPEP